MTTVNAVFIAASLSGYVAKGDRFSAKVGGCPALFHVNQVNSHNGIAIMSDNSTINIAVAITVIILCIMRLH